MKQRNPIDLDDSNSSTLGTMEPESTLDYIGTQNEARPWHIYIYIGHSINLITYLMECYTSLGTP